MAAKQGASTLASVTYGYEATSSRLQAVTNGVNSATYSYIANSPLVSQIVFKQNGTSRMTTTKQPDNLNRLTSISSAPSGASTMSFTYLYNAANLRTRATLADGSYWLYTYDTLGQVQSGKKYWSDGTPVAGQQFEYTQDDIGNRTQTKAGGDSGGGSLRTATYTPNSLNQYSNRTVPNAADIIGTGDAAATVTVNSQATYRRSDYYHKALTLDNSTNGIFPVVKVSTVYGGNSSNVYGKVFLPKTPEAYTYDLDGNLTSDGRWNYVWDDENRLIKMESLTNAPPVFRKRLDFEYDWQGRRIKKKVTNLGTWVVTQTKFLYDRWNLVTELNATDNTLIRSYVWGLDLSGTSQGAGGVGGLLAVNDAANGVQFVGYDGNGNVAALVKATDGTVSAQYEYGPFGENIRVTGSMGKINPVRFSSKYTDDESDFLYYGYRYYNPGTGKWLCRDVLEEKGGPNIYGLVGNDTINAYDYLGLAPSAWDWTMAFKWLVDPLAGFQPTIIPWNRFDPTGLDKMALEREWLIQNLIWFLKKCKEAPIGSSTIPSNEPVPISLLLYNKKNLWISYYDGSAFVSPLAKGVSLDKNCKKCVFNYHLLLMASDKSNFNNGNNFGNAWIFTQDDTWIWVRGHTPLGYDYVILGSTDVNGEWSYEYTK